MTISLKKLFVAICIFAGTLIGAHASLQNDAIDEKGNYTVFIRPYGHGLWKKGKLLPAETSCKVDRETWLDIRERFLALKELMIKVNFRKELHTRFITAMGQEESEMSDAAVRFIIVIYDDPYFFDRYGHLWIDGRFVTADELKIVQEIEKIYTKIHDKAQLSSLDDEAKIIDRAQERTARGLPIFRGFEDDRYQEYDALILKLVAEFNNNRASWAGSTEKQANDIRRLRPEIVKAHMIEETGGKARRSAEAWKFDPLQVNVPGDWNPYKSSLGLKEPKTRNEGTAEQNIRAAIMYLTRKGFGSSGQPAANRPNGFFDGWPMALRRYNGRNDETADGRHYKEAYAERIIKRADEPDNFVPISIPLKK